METAGKFVDDETLRDAMKENGIGRPSSRAGIIETLIKRKYVRREKKSLVSNQSGRDLIGIIQVKMLKSPELTGQWEKKLRDIEFGKYTLEAFMGELEAQLRTIITSVKGDASGRRITVETKTSSPARSSSGRSGKPTARTKLNYSDAPVKEGDKCPICGKGIIRKGPYGLFCSEYKKTGCRIKKQ